MFPRSRERHTALSIWTPMVLYGDKSPAESGENSPHSKARAPEAGQRAGFGTGCAGLMG